MIDLDEIRALQRERYEVLAEGKHDECDPIVCGSLAGAVMDIDALLAEVERLRGMLLRAYPYVLGSGDPFWRELNEEIMRWPPIAVKRQEIHGVVDRWRP